MQKMFSVGLNGCTRSAGFLMLALFSIGLIAQEPFERTEQRTICDSARLEPAFVQLNCEPHCVFPSAAFSKGTD